MPHIFHVGGGTPGKITTRLSRDEALKTLSETSGVKMKTVREIFDDPTKHKHRIGTVEKLANALNVPVCCLLKKLEGLRVIEQR